MYKDLGETVWILDLIILQFNQLEKLQVRVSLSLLSDYFSRSLCQINKADGHLWSMLCRFHYLFEEKKGRERKSSVRVGQSRNNSQTGGEGREKK